MSFDPARKQCLLLKEFPFSQTGQLTVSAWVYARNLHEWGLIAENWGETDFGQINLGLFRNTKILHAQIGMADGTMVGVQEPGQPLFPTGKWEHVACVTDSAVARLFHDGRLVDSAPCGKLNPNPLVKVLGIGWKPIGRDTGYWDGKMDELAVFHRALSVDEIRRMYDAGKP